MSWIFDTKALPGTNPWSWEWGTPNSFAGRSPKFGGRSPWPEKYQKEAPAASAHGDTTGMRKPTEAMRKQLAGLVAFSEAMKTGKHSTPCEMRRDSRGNALPVKSTSHTFYPEIGPPPGLAIQNALNLEASEAVKDLLHKPAFMSTAYPKPRIDHGRAGDDILMRCHRRHGTFAGAQVYVKPSRERLRLLRFPWDVDQAIIGRSPER
jgi:hypothetical protein